MRVAGIGFRAGAGIESLRWVLEAVETQGGAADALATVVQKAPALRQLAAERRLPLQAVAVAGVKTPTHSPRIAAMHGTGSVAEAAALSAAGQGATIIVTRITAPDGMATCAMAEVEGRTK